MNVKPWTLYSIVSVFISFLIILWTITFVGRILDHNPKFSFSSVENYEKNKCFPNHKKINRENECSTLEKNHPVHIRIQKTLEFFKKKTNTVGF